MHWICSLTPWSSHPISKRWLITSSVISSTRPAEPALLGPRSGNTWELASRLPKSAFSKELKVVISNSLKQALQLSHNYIGTEHLLLGLLTVEDDPATIELNKHGVTYSAAHTWLVAELAAFQAGKKQA